MRKGGPPCYTCKSENLGIGTGLDAKSLSRDVSLGRLAPKPKPLFTLTVAVGWPS